jgi:nucleoid-associated protein YgaU
MCLAAVCAQSAFSQSLGEIARRQRAKDKENPPAHVYTNDDMKRQEILLPTDRARFDADRKAPQAVPSLENAAAPAGLRKPAEIPLGTVARYYRELKQLREQQGLARERVLPGDQVLATPTLTTPAVIPALRPRRELPHSPARRDPFSRHPREQPVAREAQRAGESVRVERGDSLWKLAARYLGDGAKWHEIFAMNPGLADPNLIRVGERIQIPEQAPAASAANQQRVERGDSLWKLAQSHLGSGFAWTCLAAANPQISDANRIYPGQILTIPASCGSASAASLAARTLN